MAGALDLAHFGFGGPQWPSWLAFASRGPRPGSSVRGGANQWTRNTITEWHVGIVLFVAAAFVAWLLVARAGYQASLIDYGSDGRSNTNPPTLYTAVVGLAEVGILMILARALDRLGARYRILESCRDGCDCRLRMASHRSGDLRGCRFESRHSHAASAEYGMVVVATTLVRRGARVVRGTGRRHRVRTLVTSDSDAALDDTTVRRALRAGHRRCRCRRCSRRTLRTDQRAPSTCVYGAARRRLDAPPARVKVNGRFRRTSIARNAFHEGATATRNRRATRSARGDFRLCRGRRRWWMLCSALEPQSAPALAWCAGDVMAVPVDDDALESAGASPRRRWRARRALWVLVVAVAVVVVVGAVVIVRESTRKVPSFPSLTEHPDPSLHGTVAYYAEDGCVHIVSASGAADKSALCLPRGQDVKQAERLGKLIGPQLVWLPDGRLEVTMFRMTGPPGPGETWHKGWQKRVHVATGAVEEVPFAEVPARSNLGTRPTVSPTDERVTFSSRTGRRGEDRPHRPKRDRSAPDVRARAGERLRLDICVLGAELAVGRGRRWPDPPRDHGCPGDHEGARRSE